MILFLLFLLGITVGFFNTIAGGGSLLTLPMLIFMGLPPVVANATNRVGILCQNISANVGFYKKGVRDYDLSMPLGIAALIGAFIGAQFALKIPAALFNKILAGVMIMVSTIILIDPMKRFYKGEANLSKQRRIISFITYFFIGIYGGFIQAGIGFLTIASLSIIHGLDLVRCNAIKVMVALFYAGISVAVFAFAGVIYWKYAIVLAAGTSIGGGISSRMSVTKGHAWIKKMLVPIIIIMAIRLLFMSYE